MKLLFLFIIICVFALFLKNHKKSNGGANIKKMLILLIMFALLIVTYSNNIIDKSNKSFNSFQKDSESLVSGIILSYEENEYVAEDNIYGLGRYMNLRGAYYGTKLNYISNDLYLNGYSKTEPAIVVSSNNYIKSIINTIHSINFEDGSHLIVNSVQELDKHYVVYLDFEGVLSSEINGSLDQITLLNEELEVIPSHNIIQYTSQYGLQGKIFVSLNMLFPGVITTSVLNMVCSILTAFVCMIVVVLIAKKYNLIMAMCFYGVFWLSPWIVNFARNLYWVEFTWFLPMIIGLLSSLYIDNRRIIRICYLGSFLTIFIKSLCGYEYLTTIMMGLIVFLIADMVAAILKRESYYNILKKIFIIGIAALLGFIAAICIHSVLRGEGNIREGLKIIFEQDVLRRTLGGNPSNFDLVISNSISASILSVLKTYFKFNTQIIAGINSNMFIIIVILPLLIFIYDFLRKKVDNCELTLYILFLFSTLSWFILGKSHSYIHTHMNYVLWYFGFVQICFYIPINRLYMLLSKKYTKHMLLNEECD